MSYRETVLPIESATRAAGITLPTPKLRDAISIALVDCTYAAAMAAEAAGTLAEVVLPPAHLAKACQAYGLDQAVFAGAFGPAPSADAEETEETEETDDPDDQWELIEAGYHYDTVSASSASEALAIARENVNRANYDGENTLYIGIAVQNTTTEEYVSETVTLEPDEPECSDQEHEWCSPHEVLGGLAENPGVWSNGGGVIIREVCCHCGTYRVTDTWAQDPDTGEQGLTSVSYEGADDVSLAWVASLH